MHYVTDYTHILSRRLSTEQVAAHLEIQSFTQENLSCGQRKCYFMLCESLSNTYRRGAVEELTNCDVLSVLDLCEQQRKCLEA